MFSRSWLILIMLSSPFVLGNQNESDCKAYSFGGGAKTAITNVLFHASFIDCPKITNFPESIKLILVMGDYQEELSKLNQSILEEVQNLTTIAFVMHGYVDSLSSLWMPIIARDQNRIMGPSSATFIVDYSSTAYCVYHQVVNRLEEIAEYAATTIHALNPWAKFYCTGHSLGSHGCGLISKSLIEISSKRMVRIVALDPAGPLFYEHTENRLRPDLADSVLALHTDKRLWGSRIEMGTVDIFIDDDKWIHDDCFEDICAHTKAIDDFHAIMNGKLTKSCLSMEGIETKYCLPGFLEDDFDCEGVYKCESDWMCD